MAKLHDGLFLENCTILAKSSEGRHIFFAIREDGPVCVTTRGSEMYSNGKWTIVVSAMGALSKSDELPTAILRDGDNNDPHEGACWCQELCEIHKQKKIKGQKLYSEW